MLNFSAIEVDLQQNCAFLLKIFIQCFERDESIAIDIFKVTECTGTDEP